MCVYRLENCADIQWANEIFKWYSRLNVNMSSLDDIKHPRCTSIIGCDYQYLNTRSLSFVADREGGILSVKVQHIDEVDAAKTINEVQEVR